MSNGARTQDLLSQAKDMLMSALRAAESELKPGDVKRLETLTAQAETLQARLAANYYSKERAMAGDIVIAWDNSGARTKHPVASQAAGVALAKTLRTTTNRTVKVADALGSTYHWTRSSGVARNHWTARAVADIACD